MKLALRIFTALVLLALMLLLALVLIAPALLERPELREQIAHAARDASGFELRFDALEVALLPPGFAIEQARLESEAGAPVFSARKIRMQVALWPLFRREVVVKTLHIEGAALDVLHTDDGFHGPFFAASASAGATDGGDGGAHEGDAAGFQVALRDLRVSDSTLRLLDRSRTAAAPLRFEGIEARLEGRLDLHAPLAIEVRATLASGGEVRMHFQMALPAASGPPSLDAHRAELRALQLEPLAGWLPALAPGFALDELSGAADLRFDIEFEDGTPEYAALQVETRALSVRRGDVRLRSDAPLRLELEMTPEGIAPIALDLSPAQLRIAPHFDKPAGAKFAISAVELQRTAPRQVGRADGRLTLPGAELDFALGTQPQLLWLRLDAEPFELAPLLDWLPAWQGPPPVGRIGFDAFKVVRPQPLEIEGALLLDAFGLPFAAGALLVSGRIEGRGDAVLGEALKARFADEPLELTLRIAPLAQGGLKSRATVGIAAEGIESAALLAALGAREEVLSGPLSFDAELHAPLDLDRPFTRDVLRGRVRFAVAPGRLRGVSLLRSSFNELGRLSEFALLAGAATGRDLRRFYEDKFTRLSGSVELADGKASSRDMKLDYRAYRVRLSGDVELEDGGLDLAGELILLDEIQQQLADRRAAPASGGNGSRPPRVIPLAKIGGTLREPKVTITRRVALGVARDYLGQRGRLGDLQRKLDEELGEGAGRQIFDALEELLGGEEEP